MKKISELLKSIKSNKTDSNNKNNNAKSQGSSSNSSEKTEMSNLKLILLTFKKVYDYAIPLLTPFLCFVLHEYTWRIKQDGDFNSTPFEAISSPQAICWNIFIFYMVWIILTSLIGKSKISSVILVLLSYIFALTNYFLIMFRSAPFAVADLFSLKTATAVQSNYEFTINSTIVQMGLLGLLLIVLNIIFGFKIPKLKTWWQKLILHLAPAILAFVGLVGLTNYLEDPNLKEKIPFFNGTLFTPTNMASNDGYFLQLMYQVQFANVKKPDGYSVEKAKQLLKKYSDDSVWDKSKVLANNGKGWNKPNEKVDVIAIMNESFSDIAVNGKVNPPKDYMPYIRSLMTNGENTVSGYMYASVLGGNTANTEFEFLTGHTMAYLPQGSIAYQQFIHGKTDSCVNLFKKQGYHATGAHPYVSYGWKRRDVYPWLGFDDAFFARDMGPLEKIRIYASDRGFYKYLESKVLTNTNPLFSFNVTMQNHGGYGGTLPTNIEQIKTNDNNPYLNMYLTLIKASDDAFKEFINYIKARKKPTIVMMFGDHQPNDSVVSSIYSKKGIDPTTLSGADRMVRYKVPVIIWANYDIPEYHNLNTSSNYLSGLLTKLSGLKTTPYQNFLENLSNNVPVICTQGFYDNTLAYHDIKDLSDYSELTKEYKILQYYLLFDKD